MSCLYDENKDLTLAQILSDDANQSLVNGISSIINESINNIINEFANKSALDDDSVKYLRILSIYPNESMKVLNKCRNGKVDITNEDIVNKLKNAKECDDIKLL